jgi:ribosome-associated protein
LSATPESVVTANLAACAAADKLAADIVAIDVGDQLGIADVFLIASAENERQVGAVVDFIEEVLLRVGIRPLRREGKINARWVLLDYGDVVVHIQHVEERAHYALERIWADCPALTLDLDAPLPAPIVRDTGFESDDEVLGWDDEPEDLTSGLSAADLELVASVLEDGEADGAETLPEA